MPAGRRRLDAELVRRGLVDSIEDARAAIAADEVTVGGAPAANPARMVASHEPVQHLGPPPRFVSRAGDKLDAALDRFGLDVTDRRAIDVGASTGGFTDCLLQRGTRQVVALDVGHGQLDQRLRLDPRVVVVERCNVRSLAGPGGAERRAAVVGEPAAVVVADLSFISLTAVVDALVGLVATDGHLVVLVKPQFEATRAEVSPGRGVVRDPAVWRRVLTEVIAAFDRGGACIMGAMASPTRGTEGNVEFLVHLVPGAAGTEGAVDIDRVVAEATGEPATGTGPTR